MLLAFVFDADLGVELFRVALATLAGVSSDVLLVTLRFGGMWQVSLTVLYEKTEMFWTKCENMLTELRTKEPKGARC